MKTKVEFVNGKPAVNADGKLYAPLAYTTYFDECGEWSDFIGCGYKMFFVNVSFTDLPINNITGFTPFLTGVFEGDVPDYSGFDGYVRGILSMCPDALIFPRINISMPLKWVSKNTYETVRTPNGGARESVFSDLFMRDGAYLLNELVSHIRSADYSENIAGYQVCGGTTQEWIHHDLFGSYSEMGMKKFREWVLSEYGTENIKIPEKSKLTGGILTEEIKKYYEFCSVSAAKTVEYFAKELKAIINGEQIVGAFYGYNCFVNDPLWGLHGLRSIIDSPYIDFFSSPCCYDDGRNLGLDWGDMLPVDSVKLHGKMCFIECDIRTHLTERMQASRPGVYPDDIYQQFDSRGNKTVWCGPDTCELSLSAVTKAFAHQVTKASGIWWFDMWGGWYHDEKIMACMKKMHSHYSKYLLEDTSSFPSAETVLFIDEKAYSNIPRGSELSCFVNNTRVALGNTGIPFDIYMVEDAEKIIHKYKAAIFPAPSPSESGIKALELCRKLGIACLSSAEDNASYSTQELRSFLVSSGVHCYNSQNCVVYCSNGFLAVHTVDDGEVNISLPEKYRLIPLLGTDTAECETDKISFIASKHSTAVFGFSLG